MSLLKKAPPAAVRSLDEMFAIAQTMEHDAAAEYARLARICRAEGQVQLVELFERLANEERGHERSVLEWSQQVRGKSPHPEDISWMLPETFDKETAEQLALSRLASSYRVLSLAVRNEERAFSFWCYIVAEAETDAVRQAAERMAREELNHVALLRRARREAYHARFPRGSERTRSVTARLREAARIEARIAALLDRLALGLPEGRSARARRLAEEARAMGGEIEQVPGENESVAVEGLDAESAAERAVELYLDIGDLTRDEQIAVLAQSLATRAIPRLAWLRSVAGAGPSPPSKAMK